MGRNNKEKRDVLGNILQGTHPGGTIPGLDELTVMIERYSKPLIDKGKIPPSPHRPAFLGKSRKRAGMKTKATHYLTKEVFRELDVANNFLRGLLPAGSKMLATKSKIVNYAVKMILDEFDSKGEQSELVKNLLKDDPK
ncbi:MAG: hypothetical protein HY789_12380 [Deltaproteobacteria bacterium]|nr:hypothetical protein [Deltaproteobacteria bacterium]